MEEDIGIEFSIIFWKRVCAFLIDNILLLIIGFFLGSMFESVFVEIGRWGVFVGIAISLVYFGVMNSELVGGQTVGKKYLYLKVVDSDGKTIGLGRSVIRYFVLYLPVYLAISPFVSQLTSSYWAAFLSIIIYGLLLSTIYLYIFNRRNRRSLHDLVAGTLVVGINSEIPEVGNIWKGHLISVASLFVFIALIFISLILFFGTHQYYSHEEISSFKSSLGIKSKILNIRSGLYAATIASTSKGIQKKNIIRVELFLGNRVKDAGLAFDIATLALDEYPEPGDIDEIEVIYHYDYNIGIFFNNSKQSRSFNVNSR